MTTKPHVLQLQSYFHYRAQYLMRPSDYYTGNRVYDEDDNESVHKPIKTFSKKHRDSVIREA